MGWSGGSRMMDDVMTVLMKRVRDKDVRYRIYKDLIAIFEDFDCDTLYECQGRDKVFDEVWNELYPNDEDE